ncbi:MAG: glutaredoxin family protein [Ottowia sp.]|uniref:glutaredoxin family protein n=1 Tax=Ottowia sp. TaxID=1898956 RepID=UPI0039E67F1A
MTPPKTFALLALLAAGAAQAQVYRNVGPDGRVTYSDQPPAAGARAAGGSAAAGGESSGGALPYQLNQTAQRYPVTLYSSKDCAGCNAGRNLLVNRGIPFTEKTVESNDDLAALQRLAGGTSLPVVTIGQQRLTGFSDQDWSQYLDAAGYPKTSQLPGSYRRPSPTPLVAARAPAPAAQAAASAPAQPPEPSIAPARNTSNPTGLRF